MYKKVKKMKEAAEAEKRKYDEFKNKRYGSKARSSSPEIIRKNDDIREDPQFQGQTIIQIQLVPLKSVDNFTDVTDAELREWILFAAVEEDPVAIEIAMEIFEVEKKVKEVDKKIAKIPLMVMTDQEGKELPVEVARAERNKIYDEYAAERLLIEKQIEEIQTELQNHINWRKTMGVKLTKGDVDKNTETCTWFVELYGTDDVKDIEDLLIEKEDWAGIRLAAGNKRVNPPYGPYAGRGQLPDGGNLSLPNYQETKVNISGARISRIPQGTGLFQKLDRDSAAISDLQFGVFYGDFEAGRKNGYGIDISDAGVYTGSFENDFKNGRGRIDLADGTTIIGHFGIKKRENVPQSQFLPNPYLDGEPHGEVEIYFGDGGYYKGLMENGRITGKGDYQSAYNEVLSGTFKNGLLHGENNFLQNQFEDIYYGDFKNGEIDGNGKFFNRRGDSYEGSWKNNLRHGRGIARYKEVGCYRGYWLNGFKHGKGTLEYGFKKDKKKTNKNKNEKINEDNKNVKNNIENKKRKNVEKTENLQVENKEKIEEKDLEEVDLIDFKRVYQGYFLSNNIINGGNILNTDTQISSLISRLDKRSGYSITKVIQRESRVQKQSDRLIEKLNDMELHVRDELKKKKVRIFNQQKHYAKKSMYKSDMENLQEARELEVKQKLREERLQTMNIDKHPYKKAIVPRLKLMNSSMVKTLTNTYETIKPDKMELNEWDKMNDNLIKVILSDFEEAQERNRFVKYDNIWKRAEAAFQKAQNEK